MCKRCARERPKLATWLFFCQLASTAFQQASGQQAVVASVAKVAKKTLKGDTYSVWNYMMSSSMAAEIDASAGLPFFVYGTLMDGYKNNAAVLRGRHVSSQRASLDGVILWHYPAGFPGMERVVAGASKKAFCAMDEPTEKVNTSLEVTTSSRVMGELLQVPANVYTDVLRDLDALEDFFGLNDARNFYEREVVTVTTVNGEKVRAWTYFTLMDAVAECAEPVPTGDWRAFMIANKLDDAADDWGEKQKTAAAAAGIA